MFKFISIHIVFLIACSDLIFSKAMSQSLQKNDFEGIVCYDIIFEKEDSHFPDYILPSMEVIVKEGKYAIHVLGEYLQILKNEKDSTFLLSLFDANKEKNFCVYLQNDDIDALQYVYTADTMQLLGFKAYKVLFYSETNQVMEVWVTKELNLHVNEYLNPGLEGFPLIFYIYFQGRYLQVQVSEFKKEEIADDRFLFPENCVFVDSEEFQDIISENDDY